MGSPGDRQPDRSADAEVALTRAMTAPRFLGWTTSLRMLTPMAIPEPHTLDILPTIIEMSASSNQP